MVRSFLVTAPLALVLCFGAGCGGGQPTVVRGSEAPGLDQAAFSTGLDGRDLGEMLNANMARLGGSAAMVRWQAAPEPPIVSVLPIRNETTEHIEGPLQALIGDVETALVNLGAVRVVSLETQPQLMAEVRRQQSDAYDQAHVAAWGRQLGAQYIVTGKVFTNDEIAVEQRRVQYFLFLQVLDVATGEILYQERSSITKAIVVM